MYFKWNNALDKVVASSALALFAATSLYAIPKGPCDPKPPEACCEEPKPGPFGFAFPMDMNLSCPRDFYVHVDGLAFQAKQDGMEFAIFDSNAGAPINRGEVRGFSTDSSDWDYNPGIRFGMGFYLDHDNWNLDFNWTWLNITNHARGNSPNQTVIPLWILGTGTPAAQVGTAGSGANWGAHYNTFDIRLGKPFHVSRYLVFNPHFGVRAGWIDQDFTVDYGGGGASARTIFRSSNDCWGFGTRAGVDTSWLLGKGWELFGNVSGSMLFAKFQIDQNVQLPGGADGYDVDYNYYQNTPNFEMAVGLGWGRHFSKGKYHINLRAAYEFIEWFDQFNLRKFFSGTGGVVNGAATAVSAYANDVVSRGNLTLNGFSLRVALDI